MNKNFFGKFNLTAVKKIFSIINRFLARFFKGIGRAYIWSKRGLVSFSKTRIFKISIQVILVLAVFLSLIQAAFAVMIYGFKADDKITKTVASVLPYPIAVANYDFVTYKEYQNEKDYIHHFYAATEQEGIDYNMIDGQILDQLIENKLVSYEAMRYGATVSKQEVDDAINNIIVQNGGQEKVEKVLNDLYGLTLGQFRRLVKTQIVRDKINDQIIARVEVRHILIRVDSSASDKQVADAKTKIEKVKKEIDGGLDFGEAAKKYSEDTGSADQGGLLESFARGEMVDEFSDAAFTTPVGQISEPIRTEFGWHLIKVESKTGTIDMKFSDWIDGLKNKSLILKFF